MRDPQPMTALVVLLAVVVSILTVLVIGLLRSHAEILRGLHDAGIRLDPDQPTERQVHYTTSETAPEIRTRDGVPEPRDAPDGQRAMDIVGLTPSGGTKSVAVARTEHRTLLAFLTTGCATCAGFWQAFAAGVELPPNTRLVVVTQGTDTESPAEVAALASPDVAVVMSTEAWDSYAVPVAPYFVMTDGVAGTVIGEGAAATWERVVALLGKAVADSGHETTYSRREILSGRERRDRVDRELMEAGLLPGDPRLYHDRLPVDDDSA
ncbi:MAG TPA: hypothetical protein VMW08_17165 [Acidimicrobiales bacterium]|nr:hypothetical protein [Acidimicrobiales bacterium]